MRPRRRRRAPRRRHRLPDRVAGSATVQPAAVGESVTRSGVRRLVRRLIGRLIGRLGDDELRAAAPALVAKVTRLRPAAVAFLRLTVYRVAFDRRRAAVGPQPESMARAASSAEPERAERPLPAAGPRPPLRCLRASLDAHP